MNNNFIDNQSSEYDIALNNAMRNGLCWLPWIGKYYSEQPIKILVVGESHYASNKIEQRSKRTAMWIELLTIRISPEQ